MKLSNIYRYIGLLAICITPLSYSAESISNANDQSIEDLFLHPEYEKLKIEYDIEWTLEDRGTQQYRHIITVDNGVWVKELIAPAGVIFVTDQHTLQTVDLNKNEWQIKSLLHPVPEDLPETLKERFIQPRPIVEESQKSLRALATSPVTVSELFGLSEKVQVFYGDGEVSLQESSINNMNQGVYFNETLQQIVAIYSHDMMGRLKEATYLEKIRPITRELIYGAYKELGGTSISYPETLTMKRYVFVNIPERNEDNLTEEATLTNIVVTTDF